MTSCASTAKFPVSSTAPAADITATKKQDKHKNYVIDSVSLKDFEKRQSEIRSFYGSNLTRIFGSSAKVRG
jgi:hypothetical protein